MENNNTPQQFTANSHIISQLAAAKGCSVKVYPRYSDSPERGLQIMVQENTKGHCFRIYNTYDDSFTANAFYETTWNMASGKTRRNYRSAWAFEERIGYKNEAGQVTA